MIILINGIILEFLSSWLVNSDAQNIITKANKLLIDFAIGYNDVRAFKAFKWTAGCIFKCETAEMKLPENIKKWIFKQKLFCIM